MAETTTLHVTVLSSHYVGVNDTDDSASASFVASSAAHKKDTASVKAGVAVPKAASKDQDTYACRTSAEQLDSIARVLRTLVEQQHECPLSAQQPSENVARHVHRVQLAKAVRDGALPWLEVVPHLLEDAELGMLVSRGAAFGGDARSTLSTSSLLSDPSAALALAPAATTAATPASRTSSRGRSSGANNAGNAAGGAMSRRRTSSGSSRRGSTLVARQQSMTDAERQHFQAFVSSQLPMCEVVSVPATDAAIAPSSPPTTQNYYPIIFLYRLINEEEVVAALAALSSAGKDEAGGVTAERERQRRRTRASQASALVTRAVWHTLRPVLRAYLHRTGAAVVPTHLSVVWAVAEPCLLEGLNGYSSEDGRGDASFFSCPLTGPAADAVEVADGMTSVERWVRLVPRGVVYLYDPVSLSGSGAATVEAALAAFHVEHAADGPRSPVEAGTAKGDYRRGSADGGTRNAPPQRGSQATSSVHKAPRGISGGTASAAVAATRGRGGNGRDDGGLVSCTTTAATAAGNEPLSHALADPVDAAATTAALVDFDADPSAFPYCAVDAASLACYLYAGCDSAADSAAHATPARDLRGKAVTRFVAKAVAYQSAVLATISTKTLVNVKAKSSLRVTGELLQWMQDFLSAAAAADGDESHDSAALLNDVAKTSLTRTGLGASRWPLPLWVVAAVPLATIPPLPLRSSASVTSSAAQDAATLQPESAALSALTTWVSALAGERGDESCGGYGVELLLRQVARMGRLTSAYAAWTLQCTPRAAAAAAVNHASDSGRNADVDNDGTQEVDKKLVAGVVYFTHDAYTGGIFTVLNGVSALMAQASCSLADQKPPQMLTAVCAAAHGDDGAPVPPGTQPEAERAHHLSCCLFHRYRSPFQKLAAAQDGGGGAAETATVPRSLPAADAGKVSAAPTMATTAARVPGRCAVAVTETKESADVLLPPYPQEVVAMVRHFVAKNVGHFEVNTTRGTDTVAAAVNGNGAGASGGMASSAMVDSIVAGSFSPTARVTTLNMTTPSTDLLLRQQQQQQRRRLRGQGSGGVVPALRPYVHGVRLVKEVSKAHLGRRPNAEAAVLLQEAVESTLATPPSWSSASSFCHPTPRVNDAQETAEKAYVAKVNAFDLLQRYLTACHDTPSLHTQLAVTKAVAKRTDSALSAANAASAAAQALTARVYEHCLQQVMLHQLLREAGLEDVSEDWSVTEQVPPETIVPALVDFRERFGAHNVAVTASALDYCTHSTTPQPAAAPATVEKLFSDKLATIPTPGATVTRDAAARKVDEVHQTSAYAHNALNVHPTRRVTQLWMVGVAAPPQTSKQRDDAAAGQVDSWEKKREGERQRQRQPTSMPQSCRARKWVDMVPRAGSTTSMEVYAVWWSLLQAELKKKASSATVGRSLSSAADEGKCAPALTTRLVYQLVKQYVQRHAEASTALLRTAENIPSAPSEAATVSTAPMRFTTHETLFPCGDAMLEVWSSEAQRTCRYIKTNEVTAALHAGARPPDALSSPLRLAVRWDDGLLFSCSTTGAQQSSFVPLMDVQVTTSNFVLQRGADDAHLLLRRFPTTSSCAAAAGIAAAREGSGLLAAGFPQGLLSDACALLFEKRTTVYGVRDWPLLEDASATVAAAVLRAEVVVESSLEEAEVSCEVDERTGVVRRTYPSGTQLLLLPSGTMLTRRPITQEDAGASAAKQQSSFFSSSLSSDQPATQQWCETLITCDGRCFVRRVSTPMSGAAPSAAADMKAEPASPLSATTTTAAATGGVFRRVTPRAASGRPAPPFTLAESTNDAVHHCRVWSRQDGLAVVEYTALADVPAGVAGSAAATPSTMARVVVFPDGTSITTLAHRNVRQRFLMSTARDAGDGGLAAAIALSSTSLSAMLEEVEAVERGLFSAGGAAEAAASVRWLVEAPTLPRIYLAAANDGEASKAAFAAVFGDGTVLQRHWVPAATPLPQDTSQRPPSSSSSVTSDAAAVEDDEHFHHSGGGGGGDRGSSAAALYSGGGVATVLIRPSTSAVRVLHQHAMATLEPADVLAAVTRTSPAAYAVGLGLPFFDFAYGGGMRVVDAARCVWEVRGLAASAGPKVVYPDHPRTYKELLRELVSAHYSPHRLPRAAEMTYASEQRRECVLYAEQRSTGWCPPLVRRLRELSEPFIRAAKLLRTDVLAPLEEAAEATRVSSIRPVCFGQLANGESIRYWCAKDVIPASSSASEVAATVSAVANEPHVLQHVVPSDAAGGVLRYPCNGPSHASAAEVMAVLAADTATAAGSDSSALGQRLAEAQRLSLLCVGGLAPAFPSAYPAASSQSLAMTYASTLPPLVMLVSHGCRWLPPALQPPQQFSSAYDKSVVHAVAAQNDVAWAHNATASSAAAATTAAAYAHYVTERVDANAPPEALQAAVARRELRRCEELAQLSHYHRVLTAQWPMEQPDTAREEQVRLETRYDELQRTRRPPPSEEKPSFLPSVRKDANAQGFKLLGSRLMS